MGKDMKNKERSLSAVRMIALVAVFTALMCVISPISIPIQPVPITLATLMVYLIAAVFSYKIAPAIIVMYILLGMAGLPVFAGFRGGLEVIAGPTGGFIVGYVLGAICESLLITFFKDKKWMYPVAMVGATFFIYLFGLIWFMIYMNGEYTLAQALMACVVPFLLGDALKIVVSTLIAIPLRKLFDQQLAVKAR